jgi:PIN domain nuclease of toxin-antitoxin system
MYLLDTHILLWWLTTPEALSEVEYSIIEDPNNKIFISAATIWEIAIKVSLKKLSIPNNFEKELHNLGFEILPIDFQTAWHIKNLPFHHSDPFDRLIIATAQLNNLTLLTQDKALKQYDVNVLSKLPLTADIE